MKITTKFDYLNIYYQAGTILTGYFGGSGESQQQQIQNEAVVLEREGGELQASHEPIRVGMHHILERNHYVVLRCPER